MVYVAHEMLKKHLSAGAAHQRRTAVAVSEDEDLRQTFQETCFALRRRSGPPRKTWRASANALTARRALARLNSHPSQNKLVCVRSRTWNL